jgi:hypothetical protein
VRDYQQIYARNSASLQAEANIRERNGDTPAKKGRRNKSNYVSVDTFV